MTEQHPWDKRDDRDESPPNDPSDPNGPAPNYRATFRVLGTSITMPLVRRSIADSPDSPADHVAYVQRDQTDRLIMAFWRAGEWRDYRNQPLKCIVAWYSIGGPHGKATT